MAAIMVVLRNHNESENNLSWNRYSQIYRGKIMGGTTEKVNKSVILDIIEK